VLLYLDKKQMHLNGREVLLAYEKDFGVCETNPNSADAKALPKARPELIVQA